MSTRPPCSHCAAAAAVRVSRCVCADHPRSHQRRRRGGVSWATLTAQFRPYALSCAGEAGAVGAPSHWEWRETAPCAGLEGHIHGCCCSAWLRVHPQTLAAYKIESAAAAAASASATTAEKNGHSPSPTVSAAALPAGTVLLLVAGQTPRGRINGACALELSMAARHCLGKATAEKRLRQVSAGLIAFLAAGPLAACGEAEGDGEGEAGDRLFFAELRRLAGVRRPPQRMLCVGNCSSAQQLRQWVQGAVRATAPQSQRRQCWWPPFMRYGVMWRGAVCPRLINWPSHYHQLPRPRSHPPPDGHGAWSRRFSAQVAILRACRFRRRCATCSALHHPTPRAPTELWGCRAAGQWVTQCSRAGAAQHRRRGTGRGTGRGGGSSELRRG